jgi:hypothetical protein
MDSLSAVTSSPHTHSTGVLSRLRLMALLRQPFSSRRPCATTTIPRDGSAQSDATSPLASQNGQGIVEFALAFPIVFVLIVTVLELGFVMYDYVNVVWATRDAARAGAVYLYEQGCANNDDNRKSGSGCTTSYGDNIEATLDRELGLLRGTHSVTVTYTQASIPLSTRQGDLVNVSVSYLHPLLTPLFGRATISLSGQATAKIE